MRCPVCRSIRVVVVLEPRPRAFCASCGARWNPRAARRRPRVAGGSRRSTAPDPAGVP